ncbi:MAG: hypothetical protein ACO1OB_05220 [Archangium sp.]
MSAISTRRIFLLVLCATGAWAQSPVVMPFPVEFKRVPSGFGKEDKEALQREASRLLRQAGAITPDFAKSDLALRELKRTDCEREDACLAQLATLSGALYGLYTSIDYTLEGAVVASGRVVRDDGKTVAPTQTVKLAKGKDPFKDIARNALVALYGQLKLSELPAVRPVEAQKQVEPPKVVVSDPPPPLPPPTPLVDVGEGQRSAGKGLLVAGLGVGVVGGVLAGVGAGIGGGVERTADGEIVSGQEGNASLGRTLCTVGFIGAGVGAVTAIVGAIVWGTAAPAPVQASVSPVAGGAVVQLGGTF